MASDSEALAQHRRNQAVLSVYAERDALAAEVEGLRAALEAVADDLRSVQLVTPFTPEEIEILLDVMDEASYKDGRRDLCVKLEAMRDATL